MPAPIDGPPLVLIVPIFGFGSENVGHEISPTPFFAYTGGSATANEASGQSSFLGQVIIERDTEPWNACSAKTPTTAQPINFAG